ncbi:hypothetical protein [Candidatus Bartonella washoeensis]|uniref:Uncharacterized protein n=1 Tax=Cardidatus Bartonella washoeensis 085-0475 TaxID=1094564 RepID=J1JJT6_9HYPH|nr:hypothetical protein [Bartonella washoeensis]EJF84465.1 hypothetical protein MCW_01175 [Bartonella washoeensis 085-0475]
MRNFGSGLVYNLNDSTPVYGNACGFNDFTSHMNTQGFNIGGPSGIGGALLGGISGGPAGAFSAGIASFTAGYIGGAVWGFGQKAYECWF